MPNKKGSRWNGGGLVAPKERVEILARLYNSENISFELSDELSDDTMEKLGLPRNNSGIAQGMLRFAYVVTQHDKKEKGE
jgi:hypothetical protein